jgi:uncharacterized repeat protein (TIGR01451 family)
MSVRERARLGAVALGAGAAVLALIQILEQSVSAFNPRPVVSALITIVVAMVGVSLARARSVSMRRQFLSSVLRQTPMPAAAEADPLMLGVFRSRVPADDGVGPYIPRSVDGEIDRALKAKGFVLLIGPARSGKSRSAYEAVRRVLPERKLLIPYGGEALGSIIADPALRASEALWWLDDLDRFLPSLDGPGLNEVLRGGHMVVSSLREEAWQGLVQADGDAGEQARRLLADAFVISLTAKLTPDELAEASRLYPDVDLSNGIGAGLTADGVASAPAGRLRAPATTPGGFDPALWLAVAATAAVAVLLAGLVAGGGFSDAKPPPLPIQLEQIVGKGYRDHQHLVFFKLDAGLHGLGQQSWILVWCCPNGSDDLRIYDNDDGRLSGQLDFSAPASMKLAQHQLVNIDGFFETEFVAAFTNARISPATVPIVISWNNAARRYTLAPLLPIALASPRFHVNLLPPLRHPYVLMYRSNSTQHVPAYPVDAYDIVPANASNSALLVVATAIDQWFPQEQPCAEEVVNPVTRNGSTKSVMGGAGARCYRSARIVAVMSFGIQPLPSTGNLLKLECLKPSFPGLVGPQSVGPAVEMLRPPYSSTAPNNESINLASRANAVRVAPVPCNFIPPTQSSSMPPMIGRIAIVNDPKSQRATTGGTATFKITVLNIGNVPLRDVAVENSFSKQCDYSIGTLQPGQSKSYTCTRNDLSAPFRNVATAIGKPPTGANATASDVATVIVQR